MNTVISVIIGLLAMFYPFAVYFSINYLEPWKIAAILIALFGLRLLLSYKIQHWSAPLLIIGMVFCGFVVWNNQLVTLKFYPVLMSLMALFLFSWSLFHPPTLVERLARIQHPDLPPEGVRYTRKVTQIWCLFFVVNGGIALCTAIWGSFELWSLYNGLISYLLMGLLFAGEYAVRIKTQKHVR